MIKYREEERIYNLDNYDELSYLKYSNLMSQIDDDLWKRREKYLYHSYKNENYILPTIVICPLLLIFGFYGICYDIMIIIYVLYLCYKNDMELGKSQRIIEERIQKRNYRRVYMNMNV